MKFGMRDGVILAVVILVLGFLFMGNSRLKAANVPTNQEHGRFHEVMNKGGNRLLVEKECITCHCSQVIPLPKNHPPKEECLICHKLTGK